VKTKKEIEEKLNELKNTTAVFSIGWVEALRWVLEMEE